MRRNDAQLIDFLNHGILPFVGRNVLLDRIVELWRGTSEAAALRAMLLLGEAGAGKSRLLEETVRTVQRSNGVVVHMKLFPESATSLVPIVAHALSRASLDLQPLQFEPGDSLASVMSALRRLVHLRQTLLVFEDLHLLNGDGIVDFAALLDALGDEHAALLCLARPGDLAIRPVLERYLVEECDLPGLERGEIADVWEQLFGSQADTETLEILERVCAGNPLALRSALRGALKVQAIVEGPPRGAWRVARAPVEFERVLMRSVQMISEGMAAHLTDTERSSAARIACLGEIVAPEAARAVLEEGVGAIEGLIFKGILGESGAFATPIAGTPGSSPPLAFTHTLLHRHLIRESTVSPDMLARVVLENHPLYSVVPFQMLAEHHTRLTPENLNLPELARRALAVAIQLDATTDWQLADDVVPVAERIFECFNAGWEQAERTEIVLEILHTRVRIGRRDDATTEYQDLLERFASLTAEHDVPEHARYRLGALSSRYWYLTRRGQPHAERVHSAIEELIEQHPHVRWGAEHNLYLSRVAQIAQANMDVETLQSVQTELNSAVALGDAGVRTLQMVGPHLLLMFKTPAELAERLHLLEHLEESTDYARDTGLRLMRMTLFVNIGYWQELLRAAEKNVAWFRDHGQTRSMFYARLLELSAQGVFGRDLEALAAEAEAICARAVVRAPRIREHAATYFAILGILVDNAAWSVATANSLLAGTGTVQYDLRGALAARLADREAMVEFAEPDATLLPTMFNAVFDRGDLDTAIAEARVTLTAPILKVSELLGIGLVLDLLRLEGSAMMLQIAAAVRAEARTGLLAALAWLDERGGALVLASFIRLYGDHLSKGERTAWQSRANHHAQHAPVSFSTMRTVRVRVSMLNTIEIDTGEVEPARPRGTRLRSLLGLMVADRMLERPLSYQEFLHLVAGDADDADDARKALNVTVFRLREVMGSTAILTDGPTPRLNSDEVTVDLLEAHALVNEADNASRDGAGPLALEAITEAIGIVRGRTPFPSLFDDFFGAMREDFESRLRSVAMRIARDRLRENDAAAAEALLRLAHDTLGADTAIGGMLHEALLAGGKRAEAQRVGVKSEVMS